MSGTVQLIEELRKAALEAFLQTGKGMATVRQEADKANQSVKDLSTTLNASFVSGLQRGTATTEDFRNQLIETVNKLGLSAEQFEEVAQASELFTKQELDAARAASQVTQKAEELSGALQEGEVTTQQFGAQFGKFAKSNQVAAQTTNGFMSTLGSLASTVGSSILPFTSLGGAIQFLIELEKQAISNAAEHETVMYKLTGTLEATGRGSVTAARGLEKTASRLTEVSAFSDEQILAAYTALAKFGDIDSSGMDRLVKTALDVTAVIGGDLAGNAEMIAGILESGTIPDTLAFSDALESQVKAAVDAGNTGNALTLVLDDLNKRFGGQAAAELETYSGKMEKLKNDWQDLLGTIGGEQLPAGEGLVSRVDNTVRSFNELAKAFSTMRQHGGGWRWWDNLIPVAGVGSIDVIIRDIIAVKKALNEARVLNAEMARGEAMTESGAAMANSWGKPIRVTMEDLKNATTATAGATLSFSSNVRVNSLALAVYWAELRKSRDATKAFEAGTKTASETTKRMEESLKAVVAAGIAGDLAKAFKDAQPTVEQYSENIKYYQNVLQNGPAIIEQYTQKVEEAKVQFGEGSDQYDKASDKLKAITIDYTNAAGAVGFYKDKLGELNGKISENIAQTVYNSTVNSLPVDQQLELARSLGLISEQDYALQFSLMSLTTEYDRNNDQVVSAIEDQDEYKRKIVETYQAADYAYQNNKPITTQFITEYVTKAEEPYVAEKTKKKMDEQANQLGSVYFHSGIVDTSSEEWLTLKQKMDQQADSVGPVNFRVGFVDNSVPSALDILHGQWDKTAKPFFMDMNYEDVDNAKTATRNLQTELGKLPFQKDIHLRYIVDQQADFFGIPIIITKMEATGTNYVSGLFVAGEGGGGAEYIYAPGGATVFNPKQTRAMQDEMERMRPTEQHNNFYGPTTLVVESEESIDSLMAVR